MNEHWEIISYKKCIEFLSKAMISIVELNDDDSINICKSIQTMRNHAIKKLHELEGISNDYIN